MAWYSEKKQLLNIGRGIDLRLWEEFQDAWYNDLEVLTRSDTKDQALATANAYLKYYGAQTQITDVDWDLNDRCFLWEVLDISTGVC